MFKPDAKKIIIYQLSHKGIVLTQESNQGLLRCRQILYQLSDQGSPICQTDLHGRGGEVRRAGGKAQLLIPAQSAAQGGLSCQTTAPLC